MNTIKFSIEKERNQKLPFLDVLINRTENGKLWFEVYRKSTSIPTPIPQTSFHPEPTKKMFFTTALKRAIKYTSFQHSENQEFRRYAKIAKDAGYNKHWFNKIVAKIQNKERVKNIKQNVIQKTTYSTAIEYHPLLIPIVKHIKKKFGLAIPFQSTLKMKNIIVNDRDKTSPSGGIYSIPINFENKKLFYIGETKRTLYKRINEHKNSLISIYGNTALKKFLFKNKTAIPEWDNAKIITSPPSLEQLHWREAIEIFCQKEVINIGAGRIISNLWKPFLKNN